MKSINLTTFKGLRLTTCSIHTLTEGVIIILNSGLEGQITYT